MFNLPKHDCSLSITHNQHKDYYETVQQYLEDGLNKNLYIEWPSNEDRELAISQGDLWEMQWYPNTPIGFHKIYASSLSKLLDFALAYELSHG